MTAAARTLLGRALISEVLEEEAAAALSSGRPPLDQAAEQQVAGRIYADLWGLGGFQPYLDDPEVESVNANGYDQVFVQYSGGHRSRVGPVAASDEELTDMIRAIAARGGIEERRFDRSSPRVSVPLPGGGGCSRSRRSPAGRAWRSAATGWSAPGCQAGPQRHGQRAARGVLAALVKARKNLLISGGTAVGKTTMLRALASAIPGDERLITIEDSLELCLDWDTAAHPDVVAMQSREPNTEGEGEITLAELVRWALRMTPDRVLVGEVRERGHPHAECHEPGQRRIDDHHPRQLLARRDAEVGRLRRPVAGAPDPGGHRLLIAGAIHFHDPARLGRHRDAAACPASARSPTPTAPVASNEVWAPGPDRRAVPAVPVRAATMEELAAAGYRPGPWEAA